MKTGRSLQELAIELDAQSKVKRDYRAVNSALAIDAQGNQLRIDGIGNFDISETFHKQLATQLEIPAQYYDRIRKDFPDVLNYSANTMLKKSDDKRLVRTLGPKARANLSVRYRPLDNDYLMAKAVLPVVMQEEKTLKVESCDVTESKLYLKLVSPKLELHDKKVGDAVQAGILIQNSEIGQGSLSVTPLLYKLSCLNGAVMNDGRFRKSHIGKGGDFDGAEEFYRDETMMADDVAFFMKVQDTIKNVFTQVNFEKLAAKFFGTKDDKIESDPVKVVEVFRKNYGWNEQEKNGVLTSLLTSGDFSRFGMINAMTEACQKFDSYDRSTDFEVLAGSLVDMPKNQWDTMTKLAA